MGTPAFTFRQARKAQSKLRMALVGPSGSGKTYSALAVASELGKRVALIDTEHGSASKYAGDPFTFDTLTLDSFEPDMYVSAIEAAAAAGYDALVIDSLSHAWTGKDGALEQVDRRATGANKFAAWREVTPMHNRLIDAILGAPMHVIATMRSKTEYVVEQQQNRRGELVSVPKKVGLAPIQRDGMEYEFDVVGDIDQQHNLRITKTRCRALDDKVVPKPGAELAATLAAWLSDGVVAPNGAPKEPVGGPSGAAEVSAGSATDATAVGTDGVSEPSPTAPPTGPKATQAQLRNLNRLVGTLRDDGKITTDHIYMHVAKARDVNGLLLMSAGRDEDGTLRWRWLRDTLSKAEASELIERLTPLEAQGSAP